MKPEDVNVMFKDVAGCDEAKKEIMEFVEFLKDSSKVRTHAALCSYSVLFCSQYCTIMSREDFFLICQSI